VLATSGVVVDDDLVTGFSQHEAVPFVDADARRIVALSAEPAEPVAACEELR
jgi:hypothetical protein